jgi:phosphate-selective porin OprO and OprP
MQVIKRVSLMLSVAAACGFAAQVQAAPGVKVKDGDSYVKFNGIIQMQYKQTRPDEKPSTDELFLRRLEPVIEGSANKEWAGKLSLDFKATGDDEVTVKNAFMQYKGFGEAEDNIRLTLGNQDIPFSREVMTSATAQQLVERTLVGDTNYGSPEKSLGVVYSYAPEKGNLHFSLAAASQLVATDKDNATLKMISPVNKPAKTTPLMTYSKGILLGGRVDFYPMGAFKLSQGDFAGKHKLALGTAAYTWSNDSDLDSGENAVDSINAFELSAGFRGVGVSVDAQYNLINSELKDDTSDGLYKNGESGLTQYSVEGGYMVMPAVLELVGGYESQDADGYAEAWNRMSLGGNWFIQEHDIKLQLTYRMAENYEGAKGVDQDEIFMQTQFLF